MKKPLLTVLMPVYNAEKYLQEAIESILGQTLADFEFLIINDGSTDSSMQIIRSYNDPRIRLLQNEKNEGITATLNKGIRLAETELIARMDADDISMPSRLQQQWEYFQSHPQCALLSTAAAIIAPDKSYIGQDDFRSPYFYYNLNFECWIYHSTVMYQRQAVVDAGGYSAPWSEDFDLWWKIARKNRIAHLPQVLLQYRYTEDSLSRMAKKEEYEQSQREQILRNITYFTGPDFTLTENELECLRHHFEPIIAQKSMAALIRCLRKLDYINQCILEKENINACPATIQEAAWFKKRFIYQNLCRHLSRADRARLFLGTAYWKHWSQRPPKKTANRN